MTDLPFSSARRFAVLTGLQMLLARLGTRPNYLSNRLRRDAGLNAMTSLPPLSQDAATTLNLMYLGHRS